MKKSLLLAVISLGWITSLNAQERPAGPPAGGFSQGPAVTGRISGAIVDSISAQPVEFATVVLVHAQTKKQIDGTITDVKGQYRFQNVRLGKYNLEISFLGYRNKSIEGIELTPSKPDVNMPAISLVGEGVTLDAVEVTAEAALVENRIDKLVYNAEKDITTLGGDAVDVLQKVPLLAVDVEGNVSLRGSSNLQILINGKPSTMFAGNVGEALRTIPADQIKSVEVITVPTARYDGEGSAGIINIVTKKKQAEGLTGNINASIGNRSNRMGLGLSYGRGRFGLNVNGGGFYGWPVENTQDFRRRDFFEGQTRQLLQNGIGQGNFFGPRLSVSAFYDINAYNQLTSSLNLRGFGRNGDQTTLAFFDDPANDLLQEYRRQSRSFSFSPGFDWSNDYRRTFKKPDQEWGIGFQISGNYTATENEFFQQDLLGNAPMLNFNNLNRNEGLNIEYTLQTDYVHPFSPNVKMETGVKGVIRRIDSDYSYFTTGEGAPIPDTSDVFYYQQDVMAAYLSFNIKLGKNLGLIAGSRYERTLIGGNFRVSPSAFSNTYDNFLPSMILNRKMGEFSNMRLSYTRRIQRPSLFFINPYLNLNDPREVTVGNPELDPELTDQFELSYNTFVKGVSFNSSVYYRFTDQIIENFLTITEDGISETTFRNIGVNRSVGVNFFTSFAIKKFVNLRAGFDLFTYNAESRASDLQLSRDAVLFNTNLNATFNLPQDFKFEASGFYRSPRQSLQGRQQAWYMFSFGARKEIWDRKGSLGMSVWQPFSRTINFFSEFAGPNFEQRVDNRRVMRSINLTFSYRFGKMDFSDQQRLRRRGRISNDDMKDGGGNEGGFQG
jgi:ferric enterobactin receptor